MQTFLQAQHAAELAVLAMAVRAVLVRAGMDEPSVVSMAIGAEMSPGGFLSVGVEYRNAAGLALGGFEL